MHAPRLNVETNLRGVAGKLKQRKNWINGKFASAILSFWVQKGHLSFPSIGTLVSAITENGKNGCSSPKMRPRAKLPITDPPKVWVSGFSSVNGNGKLVSAITENGKNGHSSPKTHPRGKLPITDPPLKFGSLVFWVSMEMQNWCQPLQKMGKMALDPQKCILAWNFQLPTPLKFGSQVFWVSMEMQNWCQPLQKMGKMAVAPQKCILEQNFQLPTPPKVWVSSFLSVDGNTKLVSAITENGKNGCNFPKMHPSTKLSITDPPKV